MNEVLGSSLISAFGISFIQGLLSFFTPCVLPLIPIYLSFLSGLSFDQLQTEQSFGTRLKKVFGNTLLFVLGFSIVFIALGLGATTMGKFLNTYQREIAFGAAAVILVLAMHFIGAFQIKFLNYEKRFDMGGGGKKMGPFSSLLFGLAFAFGWTPCIGPILASVLLIAASQPGYGAFLLATYAAGLAIPFLLTALFLNAFMGLFNKMKQHMETVEMTIGAILVIAASYLLFNPFQIPLWIPLVATTVAMGVVITLKLGAKIPVRWPALIVAVAMLGAGGVIFAQEAGAPAAASLDQLAWTDAEGNPADLSAYDDQVILLNFFASWCGPCKEELPHLAKIWNEHQDEGFVIIGINMDDERADGAAFVKEMNVPYPVVYGKLSDLSTFGLRAALPNNAIVGTKDRTKVLTHFTGWPGEEAMLAELKRFATGSN